MPTTTRSQTEIMDDDVKLAINKHAGKIDEDNYLGILVYKKAGKNVVWTVKVCRTCCAPAILHDDPWATVCANAGTPPWTRTKRRNP